MKSSEVARTFKRGERNEFLCKLIKFYERELISFPKLKWFFFNQRSFLSLTHQKSSHFDILTRHESQMIDKNKTHKKCDSEKFWHMKLKTKNVGMESSFLLWITYVIDLLCRDLDWHSYRPWWQELQSGPVDQVQSPCMWAEHSSPHFHFDSSANIYWELDFRWM